MSGLKKFIAGTEVKKGQMLELDNDGRVRPVHPVEPEIDFKEVARCLENTIVPPMPEGLNEKTMAEINHVAESLADPDRAAAARVEISDKPIDDVTLWGSEKPSGQTAELAAVMPPLKCVYRRIECPAWSPREGCLANECIEDKKGKNYVGNPV